MDPVRAMSVEPRQGGVPEAHEPDELPTSRTYQIVPDESSTIDIPVLAKTGFRDLLALGSERLFYLCRCYQEYSRHLVKYAVTVPDKKYGHACL